MWQESPISLALASGKWVLYYRGMNAFRPSRPAASAFSLVELSIVLVILGLLVGGILAGQSLIKAAELRSVSADLVKFETATHAFRDKYFALPGDFNNATSFWGKDAARCSGAVGTAATPGTCNGDGDAQWTTTAGVSSRSEQMMMWQHLNLAGLLDGGYTGVHGPTSATLGIRGENLPPSKFNNVAYAAEYKTVTFSGNSFYFGSSSDATNGRPWAGGFTPEQLWNLDNKMDDGAPYLGRFYAQNGYLFTNCNASATTYNLNYGNAECYGRWWLK